MELNPSMVGGEHLWIIERWEQEINIVLPGLCLEMLGSFTKSNLTSVISSMSGDLLGPALDVLKSNCIALD